MQTEGKPNANHTRTARQKGRMAKNKFKQTTNQKGKPKAILGNRRHTHGKPRYRKANRRPTEGKAGYRQLPESKPYRCVALSVLGGGGPVQFMRSCCRCRRALLFLCGPEKLPQGLPEVSGISGPLKICALLKWQPQFCP